MYQVSPMVEEVATEEEVNLYMEKVEEIDLDMDEVKMEYAVEVAVVVVAVVVEAVEEYGITIVTTKIEGRITIMELIYRILRGTLNLEKSHI